MSLQNGGSNTLPSPRSTFIWAIVPIIFVFFTVLISLFVCYRRRHQARLHPTQQQQQQHPMRATNRRAAQGAAPDEGLNELGEAPPPYPGKRGSLYSEGGDLEANVSPPDYPTSPGRAVLPQRRTNA